MVMFPRSGQPLGPGGRFFGRWRYRYVSRNTHVAAMVVDDCHADITGQSSGYVYSPNYPGQYGNNLVCSWTIEVGTGQGVKLIPVSFAIEEDYDWLYVWEGELTNPSWLGSFTGRVISLLA
uniref:CUB domain-containing protein n=1 Tax=Branchiostoma floridae TaxID=7739 RepID=C3YKZ8_BRAFL|eukprot:XP_002602977.1 hypothetical protein BRAFLDRAFT_84712 [Branchiostoma floridae]